MQGIETHSPRDVDTQVTIQDAASQTTLIPTGILHQFTVKNPGETGDGNVTIHVDLLDAGLRWIAPGEYTCTATGAGNEYH